MIWCFYICIVFTHMALPAIASTCPHNSPPIVHCRGDYSPAHFNISMPPSSFGLTNLIIHPSGKAFISRVEHYFPRTELEFAHRIHSLERHGDSVSFSLINVHREDAGEYVCREKLVRGRQIRGCGQRLYYIDLEQPYVRMSRLPVDGEELRLGCEIYVPDPAAELGLNFSFHWSRDGQPISGQHDRVLAFHPVSWSDRGLYSCHVKENTRDCGSSPESTAFSLNPMVPPTVSVRRHQHRALIEVEAGLHMTLTCEVMAAFPPVPPNGFTWTFTSGSGHAQQLNLTKDTLTLGPVTREHSGQYTCQARNDQDFPHTWRHGEDSVTLLVQRTPASAAIGKDIVFKSTDKGPANFSFSLPPHDDYILLFVVNPFQEEVFHLINDGNSSISSNYEGRIVGPQFIRREITFSLMNVTPEDAGHYSCRQGDSKGPVIPDCGQTLQYIVFPLDTRTTDDYANSRTQELEDVNAGAATLMQRSGTAVILIILPFLL